MSRIRDLNDAFRRSLTGGRILLTSGVSELDPADQAAMLAQVTGFEAFTRDNDPHGEHDFGSLEHAGVRYFWKIDYYDRACAAGSSDPADPAVTARVLTVMRADEY